jgi:hypothetical protein
MFNIIILFFKLLIAHAVADFALQTDAMASGKNRNNKPSFVPAGQPVVQCWPYWLSAHAAVNGGAVYIATGSILFGAIETILHWAIDYIKCDNLTSPHQDQALHILCLLGYSIVLNIGI